MTASVAYISKSVRRDDAVMLHWKATTRYAPLLRVGINQTIGNKDALGRLLASTTRVVNGAARDWAAFYGWDLDYRNDQTLSNLSQRVASDILYIVHRGDGIAFGESMRLMTDWTKTEKNKMIRQIQGLDPRSAKALVNYRNKLKNSRTPYSRQAIEDSVNRYRNELLRRRGNLIATTETAKALNEAHRETIEAAAEEGLVDLDAATKTWLTRSGACPNCRPLSGKSIPYRSAWYTTQGLLMFPPLHPNCRCTFVMNPGAARRGV